MESERSTHLGLLGLTALFAAALLSACGPAANNADQAKNAGQASNVNTTASSNTALAACDDKKVNTDILAKIKANYSEQVRRQINWNSKGCEVDLEGYVELTGEDGNLTNDRWYEIKYLVRDTDNVIKVKDKIYKRYPGDFPNKPHKKTPDPGKTLDDGCAEGYVLCGDICVLKDTCNNGCNGAYCGG